MLFRGLSKYVLPIPRTTVGGQLIFSRAGSESAAADNVAITKAWIACSELKAQTGSPAAARGQPPLPVYLLPSVDSEGGGRTEK